MSYLAMLQRQPVLPAPMCGISDYPFRELCRRMGARLTTTQMVAAAGIARSDTLVVHQSVRRHLDLSGAEAPPEPPLIIQLFGDDPEELAVGTRALDQLGAEVIDLNMGCPARKVTANNSGSALLRDLPRVAKIFRAMRAATSRPLTVKMRWDWDEGSGAALEAARMAEAEGFEGVCLHARTRAQGYSGRATWELIGRMKEAVGIPVVGNGDVRTPADALAMMRQSGCDAVMIGRALIGDPWLLAESLAAIREGRAPEPRHAPDWPERRRMMLAHAALMAGRHGERGLVHFRKHAAAYLRGLEGNKRLRERLMHVTTMDELNHILEEANLRERSQESGEE